MAELNIDRIKEAIAWLEENEDYVQKVHPYRVMVYRMDGMVKIRISDMEAHRELTKALTFVEIEQAMFDIVQIAIDDMIRLLTHYG